MGKLEEDKSYFISFIYVALQNLIVLFFSYILAKISIILHSYFLDNNENI